MTTTCDHRVEHVHIRDRPAHTNTRDTHLNIWMIIQTSACSEFIRIINRIRETGETAQIGRCQTVLSAWNCSGIHFFFVCCSVFFLLLWFFFFCFGFFSLCSVFFSSARAFFSNRHLVKHTVKVLLVTRTSTSTAKGCRHVFHMFNSIPVSNCICYNRS